MNQPRGPTSEELRILILEDVPSDAELCQRELKRAGLRFTSRRVATRADFEAALDQFLPSLIISDFTLAGAFDGLAALELARLKYPEVPFVFVSGTIGEERAVEAMRHGATDYVLKDHIQRLAPVVRRAVEEARERAARRRAEEELDRTRNQLNSILSSLSDVVWSFSLRENRLIYVNASDEKTLGRAAVDFYIHTDRWLDAIHPQDRERVEREWRNTHTAGKFDSTYRIVLPDSRVRWVHDRGAVVRDARGQPERVDGIARDVTQLKLQEQRIERLNRIYAVLSGINSTIVRVRDRDELFRESCRIAEEHGKFGLAWVGLFDPATLDVTPVAWAGLGTEEMKQAKTTARSDVPQGQGLVGQAIRERKPVFSNDISAGPKVGNKRREEALRLGYRSLMVLPLFTEDAITGTLALFAKETNFFDDEEIKLLTELAGNISFALENIARQQGIENLSRIRTVSGAINSAIVRIQDRQQFLEETCRIAVEHGNFCMAWIGLLDPAALEVTPVVWAGPGAAEYLGGTTTSIRDDLPGGQGVLARAIRTRSPVFDNDITIDPQVGGARRVEAIRRGYRSVIVLPLIVEDSVTGSLTLFAKVRNFFNDDEVKLLDELAGNISFALEHMARQQKIAKLSRIRAVSSEINAAIVRIRERKALLEETCRIASAQGKFEMVWIGTIDHEKQEVRPAAWKGFSTETAHAVSWASISAAKGTLGEAIRNRRPAVRNDIRSDLPTGKLREEALHHGCFSTVCLPLVADGSVVAVIALFAPGQGFFDKDELALLEEVAADVSFALQNIAKQDRLDYLSYYDVLTGLPNRALFLDRAGQQMLSRTGEPQMVALILLNLERFRNINETFGRNGGDELLKLVALRLESAFNGKDYLARIGADSYGVVVRGFRDAAAVVHAVENQALGCFREPFKLGDAELRVVAKAGIATFPADGSDTDTLFKNAEAALKKAQDSGERYLFYAADMNARAAHAFSLETRLRKAVETQQFVLHYQAKVDLATDAICGLEALVRWQDPESGLVAPGIFIPLLEETGLILEVGKWVLGRALADRREWAARGCKVPRIAVNVSAIQLQQRDFSDMVVNVMQQKGDAPEALELEITESLLMKDIEASIRKLSILRGLGIHIAMDDFGTGYSSLSYVARLPITSVKIDRSFINGVAGNPQDMAIVTTIIALAHSLNLRVVAEGVETGEQARLLKLLKCDEAQGFLFSKPLPAADIEPLLRAAA